MADEAYVIEIEGLVNTVGANTILHRNLNLKVRRDEVMSLVGGSGSGKTQLVRVILGLKRPSAGRVRVFGVSWDDPSAKKVRDARRRMGMLFQNGALYSALSVYDNIAFPLRELRCLDEDWIRRLVHLKLDMVELEPSHGRLMPAELSGGMVKRVALARALALEPELLLLDEPTAGLDLGGREELVAALTALARDPAAPPVVLVTHHVEEIPPGFTHAMLVREGTVVAAGLLGATLTADNLSKTFGLPLVVERHGDRFTARAA